MGELSGSSSQRLDCYIVGRRGESIVIRRVLPGSCAHTLTKAAAWDFAKRLAEPKKLAHDRIAKMTNKVIFMDLDLSEVVVQDV